MSAPSADETAKQKKNFSTVGWLKQSRIREVLRDQRHLVDVPYNATLHSAVITLAVNDIEAVAVAAPPGWRNIGMDSSRVLEFDAATGVVAKQYIGIVTMFDVLVEIAADDPVGGIGQADFYWKMASPVSSVVGHTLEGYRPWTASPTFSILDCMEFFGKGIHWVLVPLERQAESGAAMKLINAATGYRLLTQMDLLSFLRANSNRLNGIMTHSVGELQIVHRNVLAVSEHTKVRDVIRSTMAYSLSVIPVVAADSADGSSGGGVVFQPGRGRRLVGTFSAADLKWYSIGPLQKMLNASVAEVAAASAAAAESVEIKSRKFVSCYHESTVGEVIAEAASGRVHLVWVVDKEGLLTGFVSVNGLLEAIRKKALAMESELQNVGGSTKQLFW